MKKKQPNTWFKKHNGSYVPNSWQGWLTYIPFTAYLVTVIISIGRNENIYWEVLRVVSQFVGAGVVMTWIASKKS